MRPHGPKPRALPTEPHPGSLDYDTTFINIMQVFFEKTVYLFKMVDSRLFMATKGHCYEAVMIVVQDDC